MEVHWDSRHWRATTTYFAISAVSRRWITRIARSERRAEESIVDEMLLVWQPSWLSTSSWPCTGTVPLRMRWSPTGTPSSLNVNYLLLNCIHIKLYNDKLITVIWSNPPKMFYQCLENLMIVFRDMDVTSIAQHFACYVCKLQSK